MLHILFPAFSGGVQGDFRTGTVNVSGTTYAGLRLNANGTMDQRTAVSTYSSKGNWITPPGVATGRTYSVYFQALGAEVTGDLRDEWIQVGNGTAVEWYHSSSGLNRAYTIYLSFDSTKSGATVGTYDASFSGSLDVP